MEHAHGGAFPKKVLQVAFRYFNFEGRMFILGEKREEEFFS
jgi:hypothetical protein